MSLETATATLAKNTAEKDPLGTTLKFSFGDDGCAYLDGSGDKNEVSNSDGDSACTIKMSLENFENMLAGDLNPMTAFMTGKIKVEGDMGVAMKLQSVLGG